MKQLEYIDSKPHWELWKEVGRILGTEKPLQHGSFRRKPEALEGEKERRLLSRQNPLGTFWGTWGSSN